MTAAYFGRITAQLETGLSRELYFKFRKSTLSVRSLRERFHKSYCRVKDGTDPEFTLIRLLRRK